MFQNLVKPFARFVKRTGCGVQAGKLKYKVRVIRRNLGQVLIGLDCFGVVVGYAGLVSGNQIFLPRRQPVTEVNRPARSLFSFIVVTQLGIGLAEFGIGQSEPGVCLNRLLKAP